MALASNPVDTVLRCFFWCLTTMMTTLMIYDDDDHDVNDDNADDSNDIDDIDDYV